MCTQRRWVINWHSPKGDSYSVQKQQCEPMWCPYKSLSAWAVRCLSPTVSDDVNLRKCMVGVTPTTNCWDFWQKRSVWWKNWQVWVCGWHSCPREGFWTVLLLSVHPPPPFCPLPSWVSGSLVFAWLCDFSFLLTSKQRHFWDTVLQKMFKMQFQKQFIGRCLDLLILLIWRLGLNPGLHAC